jgi:hypothetical protein
MNNQQSFLKVRLSSPIKFGALSAPQSTRFGGNGEASRNAIVLFSKKPNLILHIFSDFFLLNLTHATQIEISKDLKPRRRVRFKVRLRRTGASRLASSYDAIPR